MSSFPLVSICIPAYKNALFLKRLLDSVKLQSFKDFEVIITDDSPDESVYNLVKHYNKSLPIRYYKNYAPLGTPENWNEAIRKANGKWIKLMHHDDWFNDENALKHFVDATLINPNCKFFFSAFQNIEYTSNKKDVVRFSWLDNYFLNQSPLNLFRKVYIGNPSCTFISRDINIFYDKQFKFIVDFEYYIRCIQKVKTWHYIDEVLLNIGFHDEQVTKYTFLVPDVQIPENHLMLKQFGTGIFKNIFVYDYFWRMYRNLGIRNIDEVYKYDDDFLNPFSTQMISFQRLIPDNILKVGVVSKFFMLVNYLVSLFKH